MFVASGSLKRGIKPGAKKKFECTAVLHANRELTDFGLSSVNDEKNQKNISCVST